MVDKIWYNMEELIGGSEERGINRNIVECKVPFVCDHLCINPRINRNIVECKVGSHVTGFWQSGVLIETEWNVKI